MTYDNFRLTKSDVAIMLGLSEDELETMLTEHPVANIFGFYNDRKTVSMDAVISFFSVTYGHKKCFALANKFYDGFKRVEEQ